MVLGRVILASSSPRRRELMALLGIDFEVRPVDVDESVAAALSPAAQARALAYDKAVRVARDVEGPALVIGADTLVACRGRTLGKPADECEATDMLRCLQGRAHRVYTGICVCDTSDGRILRDVACTRVWVDPLDDKQIRAYVATGEPMDKAGAYGIQGVFAPNIGRIDGCYFNVVGLPLSRLRRLLGMCARSV